MAGVARGPERRVERMLGVGVGEGVGEGGGSGLGLAPLLGAVGEEEDEVLLEPTARVMRWRRRRYSISGR